MESFEIPIELVLAPWFRDLGTKQSIILYIYGQAAMRDTLVFKTSRGHIRDMTGLTDREIRTALGVLACSGWFHIEPVSTSGTWIEILGRRPSQRPKNDQADDQVDSSLKPAIEAAVRQFELDVATKLATEERPSRRPSEEKKEKVSPTPPSKRKKRISPLSPASQDPSRPAKPVSQAGRIRFGETCFEGVTDADVQAWEQAYPGVPVRRELARAHAWVLANPARQKKNYARFLVNWLGNANADPTVVTQQKKSLHPSAEIKAMLDEAALEGALLVYGSAPGEKLRITDVTETQVVAVSRAGDIQFIPPAEIHRDLLRIVRPRRAMAV